MQLGKRFATSFFFNVGYAFGTFIVTIANALEAGFAAAERRYAKIP